MAADFNTLRGLISTVLAGVEELEAVFDYHTENTTGYPYASFEPAGNTNEMYANTDNLREYTYNIFVYQELTKATRDNAIDGLTTAVDAIITAFDTDNSICESSGAHYVVPVASSWGEYVGKAGPVKYTIITLTIGVEVLVR